MPRTNNPFNGILNTNELFSAIYNMIISQQVFGDNIDGTSSEIVDAARVDGSMYGDTKLYYATDCLKSIDWVQDSETARNLLAVHRPTAPKCQAIELNVFRQIPLTVDEYMSKRAFADEGSFSNFNSVMMSWMGDTKRIYDSTTYNVFIGNTETTTGEQDVSVTTPYSADLEAKNRLEAQTIAKAIADLLDKLSDPSRDYNDYGFMRSYNKSKIKFVWNSEFLNKITKLDLPTIFHKDILDNLLKYSLPAKYFGTVNTTTGLAADLVADGSTIRSLKEQDITKPDTTVVHVFAGELIPAGVTVIDISEASPIVYPTYTQDSSIVCKAFVEFPPYMSAFEVGTSFFNARNLSTNHYLTFGRNSLDYLRNYPLITVRATAEEAPVDDGGGEE